MRCRLLTSVLLAAACNAYTLPRSWPDAIRSTPRAAQPLCCSVGPESEEEDECAVEEAVLFRKRKGAYKQKKDDRDKLLYDVTEVTPPPKKLGQFMLGPSAACGDLISARVLLDGAAEKTEQAFVIKSVSYRYEYASGGYKMVGKGASVKRASRDLQEQCLERMLTQEPPLSDAADEDDEDWQSLTRDPS